MSELLKSPAQVINEWVDESKSEIARKQLFEEVVKDGGSIEFIEGDSPPIIVHYGDKFDPEEEEKLKEALLKTRPSTDPVVPFSFTYLDRNGEVIGTSIRESL